jgi:hypothetical protein
LCSGGAARIAAKSFCAEGFFLGAGGRDAGLRKSGVGRASAAWEGESGPGAAFVLL